MNDTDQINSPSEDRYSRLEQFKWWKQETVRNATVMVVGSGALGNEALKNLALLGIGKIVLVDFDNVEISNLTRAILFREKDKNKSKAEVAAEHIKEINPDVSIHAFNGNIKDVGMGVFRRVDVVLGCLDNKEARLTTNRNCWKAGKPFVDGGIGGIHPFSGCIRIFTPPDSACYECSWTKEDYRLMANRFSCSHLQPPVGHIPTTPTEASIIAAMQVQEALKIIHNMKVEGGKGIFYGGLHHKLFTVTYPKREDCLSHVTIDPDQIVQLKEKSGDLSINQLVKIASGDLGNDVVLEFDRDIVLEIECKNCGHKEKVLKVENKVCLCQSCLKCPHCNSQRVSRSTYLIARENDFQQRTLADIGIPLLHLVKARNEEKTLYFELTGDEEAAMNFL